MKKILMTLMASMLLLSSTTYASESVSHKTHMTHKTSFSKKDAQALFGTNKVKVSTLDNGEMAKTEGEWLANAAGAALGAVGGGWGYLGGAGDKFTWGGFGRSVLGGAVTGAVSPVRGATSAAAAFGTSTFGAFLASYPW